MATVHVDEEREITVTPYTSDVPGQLGALVEDTGGVCGPTGDGGFGF